METLNDQKHWGNSSGKPIALPQIFKNHKIRFLLQRQQKHRRRG